MMPGRPRGRRVRAGDSGVVDVRAAVSLDDGYVHSGSSYQPASAIDYIGRDATPNIYDVWSRFPNITIPQGATIDVAYVTVESSDSSADGAGVKSNLYFNDEDDAVAPSDFADMNAKARTTAFTVWDDEDFAIDTPTNSSSMVDVVKEVVDRGSWASGNAMMLLWDDDVSDNNVNYRMKSQDEGNTKAILLHVEWST